MAANGVAPNGAAANGAAANGAAVNGAATNGAEANGAAAKAKGGGGADVLRGFCVGAMAAVVAGSATHPIDLVKVRLQLAPAGTALGLVGTAKDVVVREGTRGLFNGLTGTMARQVSVVGSRLGSYNVIKKQFEKRGISGFGGKVGSGLLAGAFGAVCGNPCDLAMVRMQADGRLPKAERRAYKHVGDAMVRVGKEEGIFALWRGTQATVSRAMIVSAAQLSLYEQSKEMLVKMLPLSSTNPLIHVSASLCAALGASLASNPFDVAKTRLQNMQIGPNGERPYRGTIHCIASMARDQGPRSLYRGLSATLARQAPMNTVQFVCLEQFNRLFDHFGYSPVIIQFSPAVHIEPHPLVEQSHSLLLHM